MLTRRWLVPLVTMLALLLSGCQLAQGGSWESLGPEQGGIVLSITTDPFHSHLIYVGTSTGVVYVASADTGPNLVPGNGIPHNALVTSLLADPAHEGTIYAGTSAGLYVSQDQSVTWRPRGTGFPSGETIGALAYATKGDVFFAGTVTHGVFSSHDQGNTWQAASVGLPASSDMNALLYDPSTGTVYAAVDSVGIFASNNLGVSWTEDSKGLPKEVHALTFLSRDGINGNGPTFYAGTDQGVYASTDAGATWSISGTSMRQPVYSLAIYPTYPGWIYAGSATDVVRSADGGHTWSIVAPGLADKVLALASVPTTPSSTAPPYVIFAGSANLWRFPPEESGGGSSTGILVVEGLFVVVLFGLTLYFVRRARRRWSAPAEIPSGGTPGQSATAKSPSPGPNRSSHASSNGRYRQSGRSQKQGPSNRKDRNN